MKQENRKCQNCEQEFVIEPDDFAFYEKLSVPPPTWCPECRMVRRLIWRNERSLYRLKCHLCARDSFSMYPPEGGKVYCAKCWFSDRWNPLDYGQPFDDRRPFFTQFRDLFESVPKLALEQKGKNTGSLYSNFFIDVKGVYLSFSVSKSENILYSRAVDRSKDCIDSLFLADGELCYENIDGQENYNCYFAVRSRSCINSDFLFDCVNCQHCFMSTNLRNKEYVFRNEQLSKEEYASHMAELDVGSFEVLQDLKGEFEEIQKKAIHKFANISKSVGCTGDNVTGSKNCRFAFNTLNSENVKYFGRGYDSRDVYDVYGGAGEMFAEGVSSGFNSYHTFGFAYITGMRDSVYVSYCHNSNNLFGCIGLRNKSYCILNKQYSKEEYEVLVPKIIEHMNEMPYRDEKGREYKYGEFFPPELSPFAYNETIAQEHFLLNKAEAVAKGYRWRNPDTREYTVTVQPRNLPDHISDVNNGILNETIGCAHEGKCNEQCTTAFKVIPQEFQFYKKMNLPLPRLCPNCRHYQRLKQRNPMKLWHRKCMCGGKASDNGVYTNTSSHFHREEHCPNEFETSYAPDRKETVYCEQCYNAEIV